MIVSGLNSNRYLVGNPIPVTISLESDALFEISSYIDMTITKIATHEGDVTYTLPVIRLHPSANGLTIDLSPYIKGLMPSPYIPYSSYINPIPNYQRFNIGFSETQTNTSNSFLSKTFIRGFKREDNPYATNLAVNDQLNPCDKIPVWGPYPSARFWINASSEIESTVVVEDVYVKQMKIPTACNPFYVRFLNSLGGYSFWMFNSWDWNTKSKEEGVIERTTFLDNYSLGFTETNTVNVDTRVKREFYPLIKDLLVSPVIQVYQQFSTTRTWVKIELKGDSIIENNYEDLIEVSLTFDLYLGNKPSVLW